MSDYTNFDDSLVYYSGLTINEGFYICKGDVGYPHNQESFNPFGESYDSKYQFPVFDRSLKDVVNGLYDTNMVMNNISKQADGDKENCTDVFYFGSKTNPDKDSAIERLVNLNTIESGANANAASVIPRLLIDICRRIKVNEEEFAKGNSEYDRPKMITITDNDGVQQIRQYLDGLFGYDQDEVKITSITFHNSYPESKKIGHVAKFTVKISKQIRNQDTGITVTVYLDPDHFFESNLGNPNNVDVWSYYDSDDPYNLYYMNELFTKISEKAENAPEYYNKDYDIDISPIELQDKVIKNIMLETPKFKRHSKMMTYDLKRRVFSNATSGTNQIHKRTTSEHDLITTMRFYIFYSSESIPSAATIIQKIKDVIRETSDKNATEIKRYVKTVDFGGDNPSTWVPNVISYVYPELEDTTTVFIRPFTSLSSSDPENYKVNTDILKISSDGLNYVISATQDQPPTYSDPAKRGKFYQIVVPCFPKYLVMETPNGIETINKILKLPFLAYVINKEAVVQGNDNSSYDFLQNYSQKCIDIVNNDTSGIQWNTNDSDSIKLQKILMFCAMVFSGANSSLLSINTPLLTALQQDGAIQFSCEHDINGVVNQVHFKLGVFDYTIENKRN